MSQRRRYRCIPFNGGRPAVSKWEMETRRLVHAAGARYITAHSVAFGTKSNGQTRFTTPDLIFRGPRIAVYLDGCYWHGCPDHFPARVKKSDAEINQALQELGWRVLRVWECSGPSVASELILGELESAA